MDDLSELEKEDSLGGGKTANSDVEPISDFVVPEVEGRSTGDEGIDPGTAGSQEAEDSPVDELPTQTQVLAEAIERTRTREHGGSSSSGDDRAGDGVDAEQPGSDGGPSSGDQLSLDEFDTDSTADRLDEESEGSELSETNSSTQHDAADDGTNSGSLKTASSETDSGGPSSEAESEPVGPAHARSPGRAPDEEQASYEDALDTDRRTAHDEAAREGIDRTAHEQELAELGRAIERERGQVVEVEGAGRENWYEIVIPWKNLYHVFKRSTYGSLVETTIGPTLDGDSLTEQNAFVGMVVIVDGDDAEACARDWAVPSEYVINESRLSSAQSDVAPVPSDYGNELPAPLLVGEYASGSQYPFLSWADGLVCSCPYKHDKPWRVLCKYELLAAVVAGGRDSIFLPVTRGIEVPHRARRFVSPEFVD